ncbi:GNAT family N-acetyltransferase [uncultured Roseobacter sp.]|uniref:GNAT family N-acetyltransferase n=1 Tax=uncultured Roseobacter sp. TaxID=114847 RepID=UPI0026283768|nr:GNAT family N-acetyltransferase [uncultured Roseobacter sp.]
MTVKERAALCADDVLDGHFTLVSLPGMIDAISLEGARGWTSPNPHPVLSLMQWTTTNTDLAAAALDSALERFREKGHGFDWMTGPKCAHLIPLLQGKGFIEPSLDVAAMVCAIPRDVEAPVPAGIRISRIDDPEDLRVARVMARGFDVPAEVGIIFHHAYLTPSPVQTSEVFAAFADDDDDPVGVGYLSYMADERSVLLRVSSVLESHRGRGIYRALVTHRLAAAAAQGRTQMFVHAYSDGSRAALEDLGFERIGTLQLHRWRP